MNTSRTTTVQGGINNAGTTRGKSSNSVAISGRKALADVGNIIGHSLQNGGKQRSTVVAISGRKTLADVGNIIGHSLQNGGKQRSTVDTGRKALADVSNEADKVLKNTSPVISKPPVLIASTKSSSALPLRGSTARANRKPGQGVQEHLVSTRGVKEFSLSSKDQKIRGEGEFVNTDCRINSRKPPMLSRKSVPTLKKVDQLDTSGGKENFDSSGKGIKQCPEVKSTVGRKSVDQVSNGWKNRTSDGFITIAPRDKKESELHGQSRRSARPIVNNTAIVQNTQRTCKLKCKVRMSKSISGAAVSSMKKEVSFSSLPEQSMVSSLPEQSTVAIYHDPVEGELQSKEHNLSTMTTNMVSCGKTKRRRSYTSLLMENSKLIEQKLKQDNLPSIDDNLNHLEVAEYIDDICRYYWLTEAQNPSRANYMSIQSEITPQMRGILVNWLIEVHFKFDLMPETLYLMISLLDRYLCLVKIQKGEMQLVGLTALLLASKYEDYWHPKVKDLISLSAESYTRDQMLGMEKFILRKLKFRLNVATPYVFMLRFLKAAQSDTKLEHLAFYLMELCLVDYESLKYNPSLICASAVYTARATLEMSPAWTPLLAKHARYEESKIRDCAEMILQLHRGAKTSIFRVTYEKYMRPECSGVAAIKPINQLPS